VLCKAIILLVGLILSYFEHSKEHSVILDLVNIKLRLLNVDSRV